MRASPSCAGRLCDGRSRSGATLLREVFGLAEPVEAGFFSKFALTQRLLGGGETSWPPTGSHEMCR